MPGFRKVKFSLVFMIAIVNLYYPVAVLAQKQADENQEQYGDPVPGHLRPCLEAIPALPATAGKTQVEVINHGSDCSISIIFELESDLQAVRVYRIKARLSPESIMYIQRDGSVIEIALTMRVSPVIPR